MGRQSSSKPASRAERLERFEFHFVPNPIKNPRAHLTANRILQDLIEYCEGRICRGKKNGSSLPKGLPRDAILTAYKEAKRIACTQGSYDDCDDLDGICLQIRFQIPLELFAELNYVVYVDVTTDGQIERTYVTKWEN